MKKLLQHKSKLTAIALVLLMASVLLTLYTPVKAQELEWQEGGSIPLPDGVTADYTINTRAYLSFRPNPIGVGQSLLVNVWLTPGMVVAKYMTGYKVTFTKPDGTKDVIGPFDAYHGDATAWFEYVPDVAGNWTVKFENPGGYFPAGIYTIHAGAWRYPEDRNVTYTESMYFKPSSTEEQPLTVTEEIVYSWPPSPLPTDYWTRPVVMEHREWWPILGAYPGTGYQGGGSTWDALYPDTNPAWSSRYSFTPWVQAPNTAHIVWKRQGGVAGIIGGPAYHYSATASPGSPNVIYAGRCYDTLTVPVNGVPTSCAVCYDLRTGEMYYTIPTAEGGVTPSFLAYVNPETRTPEVPGAEARLGWSVELLSISGGYLRKVHPWTGAVTLNVSIAPLTGSGGTFYNQIDGYVLAVQNLGAAVPVEQRYRLINWTTAGSTSNFTARIISNTTYARSSLPSLSDFNAGVGATTSRISALGTYLGVRIYSWDLWTGELLHNITADDYYFSGSAQVVDHGKVAIAMIGNKAGNKGGYFKAWDLRTGQVAWESPMMDYPWAESAFGAYAIGTGYGKLIWSTYDGVYAFNWTDGKIAWKYEAPAFASFESPYIIGEQALYSFRSNNFIVDGKVYAWNSEHTTTQPYTRGWGLHCINVTTGELIWKIKGDPSAGAVADGYLTAASSWHGYMYVFGKGKSATTIEAPMKAIRLGETVVLKGTVLDLSPAQPGTPCVSKDSMTLQMEYLHMQMLQTGLWGNETLTGVPVSLDIVDPNGNFFHIADVTTDGYSGTFGYAWTPEIEGMYSVMANFAGDESYGSSFAQTYVSVVEAVEPYPEPPEYGTAEWPEYPEAADDTPMFLGIIAAIVVVAILVLYTLWTVKKQR